LAGFCLSQRAEIGQKLPFNAPPRKKHTQRILLQDNIEKEFE
jgi:hypothetical protein